MIVAAPDQLASTDRPTRSTAWLPALDGVRGLAVIAVLLYHAGFGWARGGYLGVDVFFVLSGYLITTLLMAEQARTGRVDLRRFWARRARRLLPAQIALVVALTLLLAVTHVEDLDNLRGQAAAALTGTTNWYLLATGQSYFDSVGRPPLLRHLWSLGVEAQFYLLWPLILAALGRITRGRLPRIVAALLVTSVLSALYLAHLRGGQTDPSVAYFNTGARLTGLLAGAALAVVWRPASLANAPAARHPKPWNRLGLASLVLLVALVARLGDRSSFTYPWGLGLAVLGATGLVAAASHPTTTLTGRRGLAHPALVAIGARSFGLYLWHWPVYVLTRPGVDVTWNRWTAFGVRLVITGALSELSLRLVERPWLSGQVKLRTSRQFVPRLRASWWRRMAGVGAATAVAVAGAALATAPRVADPINTSLVAGQVAIDTAFAASTASSTTTTASTTTTTAVVVTPTTVPATTTTTPTTVAPPPPPAPPPMPPVTAVGDSVMLGAAPGLFERFGPQIDIDAVVGRRAEQTAAVVRSLGDQGRLRSTVLVHIGTNGEVRQRDVEAIVAAAGGRPVVFMTVRMDRSWEGQVNSTLASVVPTLPGARIADWHAVAVGHLDWFLDDGAHLNKTGAAAYADFVAQSMAG